MASGHAVGVPGCAGSTQLERAQMALHGQALTFMSRMLAHRRPERTTLLRGARAECGDRTSREVASGGREATKEPHAISDGRAHSSDAERAPYRALCITQGSAVPDARGAAPLAHPEDRASVHAPVRGAAARGDEAQRDPSCRW
jgi:hypothetical protein